MSSLPRTKAWLNRRHPPPKPPTSMWADLTKDYKTGHYVYKDLSKVVAFVVGLALLAFSAYADYKAGREIGKEGTIILLGYALSMGALKLTELQQNRKTTDENGNPLAVPGTAEPPSAPEIMPQQSHESA